MEPSKYDRIASWLAERGEAAYRARQVHDAVFRGGHGDFADMHPLPERLRNDLAAEFGPTILSLKPVAASTSQQVNKTLFETADGERVEAVMMRYEAGWTSLCVSTQVGCGLGCTFCATGAVGLRRNLTADEITDQVLAFQLEGNTIDSISFMGMGEALANRASFGAFELLTRDDLFNIGARRLSVSTVGIIPGMKRLTDEFPQINLTFSLHSPFHEQRMELIPVSRRYPLADCLDVLDRHAEVTGRKVYLAYLVMAGVNDSDRHVDALIDLVKERAHWETRFHVNLVRFNPLGIESPIAYESADESVMRSILSRLEAAGVHATIRRSFGVDIDAACGQLYAKYQAHAGRGLKPVSAGR